MVFSKIGGMFGRGGDAGGGGDGPPEPRFDSHHVSAELAGPVLCVAVKSESVSEREASIVYNETDALLDDRAAHLVVDLAQVEVLTSAGIGALVRLHKRLSERGGKFAVCSLNEDLADLFRLTRMDRLFILAPDRAAALGAVRS